MIQRVLLKLCPPSLRKPAFEVAERTSNICRIMLFGSSIEARCTDNSDIDIAVFGNKDKGRYIDSKEFRDFKSAIFRFDWNQDYDVLYFVDGIEYNAAIMNDINKGVEIYRRNVLRCFSICNIK